MATYSELFDAANNQVLRDRLAMACVVAAEAIRVEATNTALHAERVAWAKTVLPGPQTAASRLIWSVLAQNKTLTVAQIENSTDAALQTAVDNALTQLL